MHGLRFIVNGYSIHFSCAHLYTMYTIYASWIFSVDINLVGDSYLADRKRERIGPVTRDMSRPSFLFSTTTTDMNARERLIIDSVKDWERVKNDYRLNAMALLEDQIRTQGLASQRDALTEHLNWVGCTLPCSRISAC